MQLKDILSKEEVKEYHKQWDDFKGKSKLNSCYNVHSGMPVISEIYQFKDKPVFRTKIFQNKLRKFNPYFISDKYGHPFWHVGHYFMIMEQLYHAASSKLRDNSKLVVKDIPERFKFRKPIFWNCPISTELILEKLGEIRDYQQERTNFIFYDERKGRLISEIDVMTFYQPRAYIRQLEKIKQNKNDQDAFERLIRQINWQDLQQKRLYNKRTNLPDKDYLISQIRQGNIPEEGLHDFFSFWDKPQTSKPF
ncbi:MAG: hypothetical protein PHH54_02280 [Candidatus Nanoarchaeia archaeon]|nr:hypothetical protein [Candidatus Nanoarchaeia archaeon]MDD5740789.1 hypothetical protein [Candidatus Nanoarchaeia archaeon]